MDHFDIPDLFIKACRVGDLSQIKIFLTNFPDLLERPDSKFGWSPLYRTIICGNTAASKFLLKLGANCNFKDLQGNTILYQSVNNAQLLDTKLLLKYKADPNTVQPGNLYIDGNTCLHLACSKQSLPLVQLLISFSADPNIKNPLNGKTPLHIATESSSSELIEFLLKSNANPGLKDNFGRSSTDLARSDTKFLFFKPHRLNSADKNSARSSPLLLPSPVHIESIPEIPLESFTGLNLSPVSIMTKSVFEGFEKQGSTYLESEKNELNLKVSYFDHSRNLLDWLKSVKLEFLFEALTMGGFDDIDQMVLQMSRDLGITEEMLQGIGIDKPGYRKRFLFALEEETYKLRKKHHRPTRSNPLKCCYLPETGNHGILSATDLSQWLDSMDFPEYFHLFVEAGYDDLEQIFVLMNSNYVINDNVLIFEIGIRSQIHRQKILKRLKKESQGFDTMKRPVKPELLSDRHQRSAPCEFCLII